MAEHESKPALGVEALGTVGVFSPGIFRIPHLRAFLGADEIVFRPDLRRRSVDAVVGWGRKPNTARARTFAADQGCPYLMLEDGFLRSLQVGSSGEPPLSLVVDDVGMYYDATTASRLERILEPDSEPDALADEALLDRARRCMELVRGHGLSKYNAGPDVDLGERRRPRVLVVDQTAGDLSLELGLSQPFASMVDAALAEHPDAEILIKTHPDTATGDKRGLLGRLQRERVRIWSEPAHPLSLLRQVDHVYALTSLMGFEALVMGKPVACFGAPFYAGWGLTDDRVAVPRRKRRRSVEELFAAAHLLYSRYVDPETGERCAVERVIEHLALQRRMVEQNRGTIVCVGFSAWKRGFVPAFAGGPASRVCFSRNAKAAERHASSSDAKLLVWGSREDGPLRALAERRALPVWRMEDGFLRSVGLGSDLFTPASLVIDRSGIYYDPARPSDLERILQEERFSERELGRARALREAIVTQGISKYNVGGAVRMGPPAGDARSVVLVVGQVEDDASIRLGCLDVRRNEDLIRCARERRPEAWITFKPHPDVVSGNRRGGVDREEALRWCDEVVEEASLADCLGSCDEVHTMTSLVGFEALLRGLSVVVYGQPFYAGWGLTEDRHPHPRRTRRLVLDELVFGTLVRYPRYVSQVTGTFTTPEVAVEQLRAARDRMGKGVVRGSWAGRQMRKAVNVLKGMTRDS